MFQENERQKNEPPTELPSADQYDSQRAAHYEVHHDKNLRTRLTSWRELQCLRQALRDAGGPMRALDLPCGTGRFWPAFAGAGVATLTAGDGSTAMLELARSNRLDAAYPQQLIACSAFAMALPDSHVDFAACLRFYHHLARPEDRRALLAELRRVSRRYVAISLWVDGNLAGTRRMARPQPPPTPGYGRRRCRSRTEVEQEFESAGLRIAGRYDVWPRLSMWRLYLLEPAVA